MESNYIKSARIKLQKLDITDYESFRKKQCEVFEIIYDTVQKEWDRKLDSLPDIELVYPIPGYMEFVKEPLEQKRKPWEMQTLEYYSRSPQKFINDYFSKGEN